MSYSVGEVAELVGVTVRSLHHYDEIGLLRPSGRSPSGYRRYDDTDVARLRQVLTYRSLGFSLAEITAIVDDPRADTGTHLRRQHHLRTDPRTATHPGRSRTRPGGERHEPRTDAEDRPQPRAADGAGR